VSAIPPPEILRQMHQSRRLSRSDAGSFHLAMRLFPSNKRLAMHVIYRFCRLVDDAVDETARSIAQKKADLELLEQRLLNPPDAEPWKALQWIRSAYKISDEYFLDLIRGARMDLETVRISSFEQLRCYCYRVAGTVGLMTLHIMGFRDRTAFAYSRAMGEAFQLTNILRDVKEDREQNRCYLPKQWLIEAGAWSDWQEEKDSVALHEVCQRLARRARIRYRESLGLFPLVEKDCRFALALMTGVYSWYLREMEREGFLPSPGELSCSGWILPALISRCWRGSRGRPELCLSIA